MSGGGCDAAERFVLRVTDDSMAPDLPRGCMVVVDPGVAPSDGACVVLATAEGPLLRRLSGRPGAWRAGRDDHAGMPLAVAPGDILGVVVQRAGRRRRDHLRLEP